VFVFKNQWPGDHLDFRASLLGQSTTGTVDVAEDHVRLEVRLPWLLSMLANKAKALVEKPPGPTIQALLIARPRLSRALCTSWSKMVVALVSESQLIVRPRP
jgi:Putative polyhydroxyalkanoic acid system protein (PHA_gran_rgn)